MVVFFLFLAFYTVLYWIDLKAALDYIRNERGEWIVISFYTLDGVFRYRYDIPLVKKENGKVRFRLVKGQGGESRTGEAKSGKSTPLDLYRKLVSVKTYLEDHKDLIEELRAYLNKKNIRTELSVKLRQGTGDAARTGVLCGLLWAAAGIAMTYAARFFKLFQKKITIVPCFDKRIFEADVHCIFHVRLVHIIVVLIKIYQANYLLKMKSKKTIGGEVSG
jgi:hypothetical protein